jgi:hypothetical protein
MYHDLYGKNRVHLCCLATLPKYLSRGAEIFQIRHAMYLSRRHERRVTLFATAAGKSFYEGLGFWTLACKAREVGDEDVRIWCMSTR